MKYNQDGHIRLNALIEKMSYFVEKVLIVHEIDEFKGANVMLWDPLFF